MNLKILTRKQAIQFNFFQNKSTLVTYQLKNLKLGFSEECSLESTSNFELI